LRQLLAARGQDGFVRKVPGGQISSSFFRVTLRSPARKAMKTPARKLQFTELIQSDLGRPDPSAKIFRFSRFSIGGFFRSIPPHTEGRFAIVTDVGCGMRWTLWRFKTKGA
jgi:hypothetical protein